MTSELKALTDKLTALAKVEDDVAAAYDKGGDEVNSQLHWGQAAGLRRAAALFRAHQAEALKA